MQGGEGVVGDLRAGSGHGADERALADVGAADDGHAADAIGGGQRDRQGELRSLNRTVVAVVLQALEQRQ